MKKTLYLKFVIVYLCFGILSFVAISVVTLQADRKSSD